MLVLSRRENESIVIGDITVTVISIRGDKAHRIWMVKLEWEKKIPSPTADTKPSTPKQR